MSEPRILKEVTLRWSDGESWSVFGEDAQDWKESVDAESTFAAVHGWRFPDTPWKISLENPIAAAEARGAALVADKLADLESEQASLCDLLNTWAREEGVQQAERPGEMKSLADRLWGHLSRRVAVAETRGAALAVEQCRRLAEEMIAGQPRHNQFSDGYKAACRDLARRLRESAP